LINRWLWNFKTRKARLDGELLAALRALHRIEGKWLAAFTLTHTHKQIVLE
jgi:hypothetical protein